MQQAFFFQMLFFQEYQFESIKESKIVSRMKIEGMPYYAEYRKRGQTEARIESGTIITIVPDKDG